MSGSAMEWQDDILQMMYWMRGEHLGEQVTAEQLNRFLRLQPDQLDAALQRLAERNLVVAEQGSYRLTEEGLSEGRRRFADEFSSYLGKETHLQCADPNCDCHTPEWDGVCTSDS